jgi:hypothetical protein
MLISSSLPVSLHVLMWKMMMLKINLSLISGPAITRVEEACYDDEDVDAGLTLNCLISLIRPATLTSSLQLLEEEVALCLNLLGRRLQQCGKRSFL